MTATTNGSIMQAFLSLSIPFLSMRMPSFSLKDY